MKKISSLLLGLLAMTTLTWAQCTPTETSETTITFFRAPVTLLTGVFSVAADRQVAFSRGNLQYNAAINTWRFASHQYDAIGKDNKNIASDYDGWIDLFGWGTSGWDGGGNTNYQPWATDNTANQYGPSLSTLAADHSWSESDATKNYDWGVKNFTTGAEKGYRVLTADEWKYLLRTRTNSYNLRRRGTLLGINGFFILPDDWDWADPEVATAATAAGFTWPTYLSNVVTIPDNTEGRALWEAMEKAGAVFFPATGYRDGTSIKELNFGRYWTSTQSTDENAWHVLFDEQTPPDHCAGTGPKYYGRSVRLVQDL